MCHWDYVLREGRWMAEDFMQVCGGREVWTLQVRGWGGKDFTQVGGGAGAEGACCVRVRIVTKGFMQASVVEEIY